jgi:hypothetical protein
MHYGSTPKWKGYSLENIGMPVESYIERLKKLTV